MLPTLSCVSVSVIHQGGRWRGSMRGAQGEAATPCFSMLRPLCPLCPPPRSCRLCSGLGGVTGLPCRNGHLKNDGAFVHGPFEHHNLASRPHRASLFPAPGAVHMHASCVYHSQPVCSYAEPVVLVIGVAGKEDRALCARNTSLARGQRRRRPQNSTQRASAAPAAPGCLRSHYHCTNRSAEQSATQQASAAPVAQPAS